MSLTSSNPTNGKFIKTYKAHSVKQVNDGIEQANKAWISWKDKTIEQRAFLMHQAAFILLKRKNELAKLMALEMGKPLSGGLAEIEKCAAVCTYYAENTKTILQNEYITTEASKSYVSFQPLGVILAIMPWNFPFWQVFRFLAPALMAGNCAVLKHASNVTGCGLAIEDIMRDAGFPTSVFQTLLIGSDEIASVIENPRIKAVTFTGSTNAGRKIAEKAASQLKKVVLELGGSDPYIILHDADLELAAETCVNSRLINSGQSCIAAKRFIVLKSVLKEFTRLFQEKMAAKVMGDPLASDTDIGPQARKDLRDELHQQVLKSIAAGAVCLLGGEIPDGDHAFYPPTILTNVKKGMPAYDEELFGPVAAIISASDEWDAIRMANDTVFGLGAAIFTSDVIKGEELATHLLQAGSCFVNSQVMSDPRLPFGGIKQSGYGRELGSYGIKEFTNIKTVYIK